MNVRTFKNHTWLPLRSNEKQTPCIYCRLRAITCNAKQKLPQENRTMTTDITESLSLISIFLLPVSFFKCNCYITINGDNEDTDNNDVIVITIMMIMIMITMMIGMMLIMKVKPKATARMNIIIKKISW